MCCAMYLAKCVSITLLLHQYGLLVLEPENHPCLKGHTATVMLIILHDIRNYNSFKGNYILSYKKLFASHLHPTH